MEIRHEEFVTTLKEKDKYEKMKEKVRNVNEKQENMRLNSVIQRLKTNCVENTYRFLWVCTSL